MGGCSATNWRWRRGGFAPNSNCPATVRSVFGAGWLTTGRKPIAALRTVSTVCPNSCGKTVRARTNLRLSNSPNRYIPYSLSTRAGAHKRASFPWKTVRLFAGMDWGAIEVDSVFSRHRLERGQRRCHSTPGGWANLCGLARPSTTVPTIRRLFSHFRNFWAAEELRRALGASPGAGVGERSLRSRCVLSLRLAGPCRAYGAHALAGAGWLDRLGRASNK